MCRAPDTQMDHKRNIAVIFALAVLVVWIYCYAASATPDEGKQWSAWTYKGDNILSHALLKDIWGVV